MDCPVAVTKEDDPATWVRAVERFEALGATHIRVMTPGGGFDSPQEHLDAALRFLAVVSGR